MHLRPTAIELLKVDVTFAEMTEAQQRQHLTNLIWWSTGHRFIQRCVQLELGAHLVRLGARSKAMRP